MGNYIIKENITILYYLLYNAIPYPSLPEWGKIRITIEEQLKEILNCYKEDEYDRDLAKKYLDQAAEDVNDILSRNK